MIEINGKDYDLKFGMERLEIIDQKTGRSIMHEITDTEGMLSLPVAKACYQYGLTETGSNVFVQPGEGAKLFELALQQYGYPTVVSNIVSEIMQQSPFLFHTN